MVFDGMNVWEELYPADPNFHTWSQQQDPFGNKGFGQRIDHFIVSRQLLRGWQSLRVKSMEVHQGLGSSDHWPITLSLEKSSGEKEAKKRQDIRDLVKKGVYDPQLKEWKWDKQKDSKIFAINKAGTPVFEMKIGMDEKNSFKIKCFLDTGSPFSIFNPDRGGKPEEDTLLGKYVQSEPRKSTHTITLQGVGGATIKAENKCDIPFLMGKSRLFAEVLVLEKHEPTLPKLLIGLDALMGNFGGMLMQQGKGSGQLEVSFGKSRNHIFYGEGGAQESSRKGESERISAHVQQTQEESTAADKVFRLAAATAKKQYEHTSQGDEVDAMSLGISQDYFVDSQCPVIEGSIGNNKVDLVVDVKSTYCLISEEYVKHNSINMQGERKCPSLVDQEGIIREGLGWVTVAVVIEKHSKEIEFCVWPRLPVTSVLGRTASVAFGMQFSDSSPEQRIKIGEGTDFAKIETTYGWKTSIPLKVDKTTVIPARSQMKINIEPINKNHIEGFESAIKLIAPIHQTFSSKNFKTAWGPCINPEWVQVANPTTQPIKIVRGEHIADLHLGGGWEVENINLDQSSEEYSSQQAKKKENRKGQIGRALKILDMTNACQKARGKKSESPFVVDNDERSREEAPKKVKTHHVPVDDPVCYMSDIVCENSTYGTSREPEEGSSGSWKTPRDGSPDVTHNHGLGSEKAGLLKMGAVNHRTATSKTREEKLRELKEIGVDLTETIGCRPIEEVDLLIDWCVSRKRSFAREGKLDLSSAVVHNTKMSIDMTDTNPVFKAYAGRVTPDKVREIHKQTEEKLAQGIIEKSSAPWSSNCVCINKNGKIRIAVDYRKLNELTVKDNYLLPTIQECLDQLHGTRFFTSIDCAQAYHQIPLATERDKDLTTFVVPGGGLYRYKFMPFGLCNAGAVWTRFIDEVLEGLRWNVCLVYADDILIYTKSLKVEDHIADLEQVFDRLDKYNVKVKGDKMRLGLKELPFLGQLINEEGCRPDPEKTKAITELQAPSSVHQLRRVMGMFAYYRKYIKNFADIAAPLYELTGKNAQNKRLSNKTIALNEKQLESFIELKRLLTVEPIFLRFPDWEGEFEIHCDASDVGVASVLWQVGAQGNEKSVVMYASRMLTVTERKYHAYEREALALVWSLDIFRHYLRKKFKVITDCRSLVYLKKNSTNSRIARWILQVQEFDFEVKHRAGRLSNDCDGMTRQPLPHTAPYGEEPTEPLYNEGLVRRGIFSESDDQNILVLTRAERQEKRNQASEDKREHPFSKKKGELVGKDPPTEKTHTEEDTPLQAFFGCKQDLEGWELDTWKAEQEDSENKEITAILKHIKEQAAKGRETKFCYTASGLLARKSTEKNYRHRIVVPESLKAFVLGQHHNLPLHAHQGRERMLKMIASRYYWPKMHIDVKRWTKSCAGCARRKSTRSMNLGLTTTSLATEPWQTIGVDLVGECLETTSGMKWILTITDHFSRWPIAVAIPDKKADTIARVLYERMVAEHGAPSKILTDQGKEFVNEAIETLCKKWGVKKVVTGGYNPQANGACERFHRWMNSAMTLLYDRKNPDWDQYLPAIVFAYRVSENDATGYSPYFLNTGREPTIPSDLTFTPEIEEKSGDDYVSSMTAKLRDAFKIAREKQYKSHIDNINRRPSRQKPAHVSGDLVMMYKKTAKEARLEIAGDKRSVPTKWQYPFEGPALFEKEISNTECQIFLKGKSVTVNYNRIAPYVPWDAVIESSDEWKDRIEGRRVETKNKKNENEKEIKEEDEKKEGEKVLVGEVFLFQLNGNKEGYKNFGVGLALNITTEGRIHFQWMGNYHDSHAAAGSFKQGWIDLAKNQEYYRKTKETKSHIPFTGQMTDTEIWKEMVLASGRENILTKDHRLSSKALKKLRINSL